MWSEKRGASIRGHRLALGQRLSGWVAANRQTISNSDARLDFTASDDTQPRGLKSCLSTPLICDEALVGVMSLYSTETNGFNDDHKRIIEAVARHIARTFRSAVEFDGSSRRDLLTGLPSLRQLEQFVDARGSNLTAHASSFTLLFVDIVGLEEINSRHGRKTGDDAIRHVARHATSGLRIADILFRSQSDELVALLNDTEAESAANAGERIRAAIRANPLQTQTGDCLWMSS